MHANTDTHAGTDNLARMANQIGSFFEAMPDRSEAMENAARHIRSFWAPPMRQGLLQRIDSAQTESLSGFIAEAVRTHRGLIA
jgi:formate dehydrogenase subunit delta